MEFISSSTIIPKMVTWFNAQADDADKTIAPSEIALFKVKLMEDGSGNVDFIVNPDPNIAYPGKYLGEVVYMWAGTRGHVAVADQHSFIEISKYSEPTPIPAPERVEIITPGV